MHRLRTNLNFSSSIEHYIMQVQPLSASVSLESTETCCSSSSLFSEHSDFSEVGGCNFDGDEGTLLLVEEDDDFSENFGEIFDPQSLEIFDCEDSDDFSEILNEAVDVDESEHYSTEIDLLSEEMERELSSDSSEVDEESDWIRTKSGRPAKLLETAEDEYEKIALIETVDGEKVYRNQQSYRLSTALTQRLAMTPSGNYEDPAAQDEEFIPKQEKKVENQKPVMPVMDQFGNFVFPSALKSFEGKTSETTPGKELHCHFADLEDECQATKIARQVTRHVKALYISQ